MLGDKYSLLIEEIKNVIAVLEEQIKDKKTAKEELDKEYVKSEKQLETIERETEKKKEKLEFLKFYENKKLFITVMKEIVKGMAKSLKEAALFEKIMFVMLLVVLIPMMYVSKTLLVMIISFCTLCILAVLYSCNDIKKYRKIKSVADREKEITDLENELAEEKARMTEITTKGSNIAQEISQLDIKVAECMKNLQQAQKSRESIMDKLVSKIDLNIAFDLDITGEILRRIREIEKEGLA